MRTITIELPDTISINGAKNAPEALREINTTKWNAEFCLTALIHGISQKIGDTWSVTKCNVDKTTAVHAAMTAGDWSRRAAAGMSDAKFAEKIAKLDITKLLAALTPEQHKAILEAGGDISVVTTKQK